MKKPLSFLGVAACAVFVATTAVAQGQQTMAPIHKSESVTLTATVTAINPATRHITLKGEGGTVVTLKAPDTVKNFAQIRVGDVVTAHYVEALAIDVQKPGSNAPAASVKEVAAAAKPGEKPAGLVGGSVSVLVTVKAINAAKPSVTVQGPEGNLWEIKVKDPTKIVGLAIGDKVQITYTEALAITVKEAAKAPPAH
jgi:hypothetical protein